MTRHFKCYYPVEIHHVYTLVSYGRGQGTSFVKNQYKKDKHMGKMMSVIINFFSSLNINIK
jgi:hypothetical protein